MANNYKVLGQVSPLANTDTDLYIVPLNTTSVISTLALCNTSLSNGVISVDVAVVPSGQILSNKHYIMYGVLIDDRETIFKTIGITLAAGDKIVIKADSGTLSASVFGNEITP